MGETVKLNYKEMGSGEPLLILHGLLGSLDNWQTVGRQLSENYRVFLIDQRNHGKSPHTETMDYEVMAADLEQFMDDHGIDQAHLLGHSMGGKTVMQFALTHPSRVKKLIVADIGPKQYPHGHDQIFKALFALNPSEIESRSDAEKKLKFYIHEPPVLFFLLKNLDRTEDGFQWKMNLDSIYQSYDHILEEITAADPFDKPALFIRGEKSHYVKDEDLPQIEKLFPNYQLETLKGVGHWVHAEAQEPFLKVVEDFLNA